jgi:hypothetical protein
MAAKKKPKYFLHKNKVFEEVDFGLYSAGNVVEIPQRETIFEWKGAKLNLRQFKQVVCFFEDGYKKTDSENLIFLYYNIDTHEWLLWAPPQTCNGMTVKANSDSKEFKEQRSTLIPKEFVQLGTIHHHCGGSAFASGTDKSDEEDRDGIHITLGAIGKDEPLDIHCRASFRGQNFETSFSDWFEIEEELLVGVPDSIYEQVWLECFKRVREEADDADYPEIWLENCTKPKSYSYKAGGSRSSLIQQSHWDWGNPPRRKKIGKKGNFVYESDKDDLAALIDIAKICHMDMHDVAEMMAPSYEDIHGMKEIFLGMCREEVLYPQWIITLLERYEFTDNVPNLVQG